MSMAGSSVGGMGGQTRCPAATPACIVGSAVGGAGLTLRDARNPGPRTPRGWLACGRSARRRDSVRRGGRMGDWLLRVPWMLLLPLLP